MSKEQDTLKEAKEAFHLGEYSEALEKYDNFFEESFKNTANYGVRLSYCLSEWVKLGNVYPKALKRLEKKRDNALILLVEEREPERFHDYIAICESLESPELPRKEFLLLHAKDRALSTEVVRFIWDELVKFQEWKVCISYLPNPLEKYESYLSNLDTIIKMYVSEDSTPFEKEITGQALSRYIRNATNILLVLKQNNKMEDAILIRKRISSDLESRSLSKLEISIDKLIDIQY